MRRLPSNDGKSDVNVRFNGSGAGGFSGPVRCGIAVRGEWPSAARSATGRASARGGRGFNSLQGRPKNRAWPKFAIVLKSSFFHFRGVEGVATGRRRPHRGETR
jgi:hypothetical protein